MPRQFWDTEWWSELAEKYWYLRGFLAPLLLCSVVSERLSIDEIDLLRSLHTAIYTWSYIADGIGMYLARLFHLPYIPGEFVTLIALLSVFFVPSVYSLRRLVNSPRTESFVNRFYKDKYFGFILHLPFLSRYHPLHKRKQLSDIELLFFLFFVMNSSFTFFLVGYKYYDLSYPNAIFTILSNVFGLMITASCFLISCYYIRPFFRGFVYFAGAIVAIEVMYYLPFVGEWIEGYADWVEREKASQE